MSATPIFSLAARRPDRIGRRWKTVTAKKLSKHYAMYALCSAAESTGIGDVIWTLRACQLLTTTFTTKRGILQQFTTYSGGFYRCRDQTNKGVFAYNSVIIQVIPPHCPIICAVLLHFTTTWEKGYTLFIAVQRRSMARKNLKQSFLVKSSTINFKKSRLYRG